MLILRSTRWSRWTQRRRIVAENVFKFILLKEISQNYIRAISLLIWNQYNRLKMAYRLARHGNNRKKHSKKPILTKLCVFLFFFVSRDKLIMNAVHESNRVLFFSLSNAANSSDQEIKRASIVAFMRCLFENAHEHSVSPNIDIAFRWGLCCHFVLKEHRFVCCVNVAQLLTLNPLHIALTQSVFHSCWCAQHRTLDFLEFVVKVMYDTLFGY